MTDIQPIKDTGWGQYVAIKEGLAPIAFPYEVGSDQPVLSELIRLNDEQWNLYFTPADIAARYPTKATKEQVTQSNWAWVDIDPAAGQSYKTERQRLLGMADWLLGMKACTLVVDTGNGIALYWRLTEPVSGPEIEQINKALALQYGGDHAHNCERLMRLPGTLNWPSKKKLEKGYPRKPTLAMIVGNTGLVFDPAGMPHAEIVDTTATVLAGWTTAPVEGDELSDDELIAKIRHSIGNPFKTSNAWKPLSELFADAPPFTETEVNLCPDRSAQIDLFMAASLLWWTAGNCEQTYRLMLRSRVAQARAEKWTDNYLRANTILYALHRRGPDEGYYTQSTMQPIDTSVSTPITPYPWNGEFAGMDDTIDDLRDLGLSMTQRGKLRPVLKNIVILAKHYGMRFYRDVYIDEVRLEIDGNTSIDPYCALSDLGDTLDCPFARNKIEEWLSDPLLVERANTLEEWFKSVPWDGIDRTEDLIGILGVLSEPEKELIRCWLKQAVALALIPETAGDQQVGRESVGILILNGPQGYGKTTFVRNLLPFELGRFIKTGVSYINPKDKDFVMAIRKHWIVELGEINLTKRGDAIKAFLTEASDNYRAPYGRKIVNYPRRTVFIGTSNTQDFLTPDEGYRRYWPIEIKQRIDINRDIDMQQLWAQIYQDYMQNPDFRPSASTLRKINNHALDHVEAKIPAVAEILERYYFAPRHTLPEVGRYRMVKEMSRGLVDKLSTPPAIGRELSKLVPRGCFVRNVKGGKYWSISYDAAFYATIRDGDVYPDAKNMMTLGDIFNNLEAFTVGRRYEVAQRMMELKIRAAGEEIPGSPRTPMGPFTDTDNVTPIGPKG